MSDRERVGVVTLCSLIGPDIKVLSGALEFVQESYADLKGKRQPAARRLLLSPEYRKAIKVAWNSDTSN